MQQVQLGQHNGAMGVPVTKHYQLTEREAKVVDEWRKLGYGQMVIHCENCEPVRIEDVRKSIKL